MLSFGGFMKNIIGAITAAKVVEVAGHTDTVMNIISHAADSAERVADFLDEVLEGMEDENDFSM
jgi:hypothetical protein